MKKKTIITTCLVLIIALLAGCNNGRRQEIEQRWAALKHKQDSSLQAAQQELAVIDSTLQTVSARYERMKQEVEAHRQALKATEEELSRLNQLRAHRDSLQVQWSTLGAKIKYIRQKQRERKE